MKRAGRFAAGACAFFVSIGAAGAHDALYAARIGAVDAETLAHFYEFAFGMHEVLRRGSEIMLNFGDTEDAAKGNTAPMLIVVRRKTDDVEDPVGHLIFTVRDFAVTAQAIEAAGGTLRRGPLFIKASGDTIGFAVDPAGNQMELIQLPKT